MTPIFHQLVNRTQNCGVEFAPASFSLKCAVKSGAKLRGRRQG